MHDLFSQLVYFFKIISNIPLTTVVIQNHVMLVRFQSSSPYDVNFEFRNILNTQSRAYYRSKKIRTFSIHNFHSFIELCFENEITKMKKIAVVHLSLRGMCIKECFFLIITTFHAKTLY